jgi:hypothetical protein
VVIPGLIVMCISPNCFYNVFVAADEVDSVFTYYAVTQVRFGSIIILPYLGQSSYSPPFEYQYQCSSSFITYYAPVFMITCILNTFALQCALYAVQQTYMRVDSGVWVKTLPRVLSRIMRIRPDHLNAETTAVLVPRRIFSTLISLFALLFTFGAVFSPLAVALAVTIAASVYFVRRNMLAAYEPHETRMSLCQCLQ